MTATAKYTAKWAVEMESRRQELSRAFDRVRNPSDWRDPIDWLGIMESSDVVLTLEAIEFYTATNGRVNYLSEPGRLGRALVRIRADGYRNGPAGL